MCEMRAANFGRKPPPPAPSVRSVTRKDLPQGQATSPAAKPTMQAGPPTETAKEEKQRQISKDGGKKKDIKMMKTECTLSDDGTHGDYVKETVLFYTYPMLFQFHIIFKC